MDDLKALKVPVSSHKKQISIESKIERIVEDDDRGDLEWRTKLEPVVSVTIRRGSEVMMEESKPPSTSIQDPSTWPRWRVEVAYASFLLLTSTSSILKLVLAPLNAVLSNEFDISYLQAACLTGVPLVIGAFVSFGSAILARVVGRRIVMLVGTLLLFAGSTWNLEVGMNYTHFMIARAITGCGWGMMDAVLYDAVGDLVTDDQRALRINIFNAATTFYIWLAPVLSGYFYQRRSWRTMFIFVGMAQTISILLLIFFTPETKKQQPSLQVPTTIDNNDTPHVGNSQTSTIISSPSSTLKASLFKDYVQTLRFPKPSKPVNTSLPAKALITPSTILTFLLIAPLIASTYGLASSLALFFSIAPTFLLPKRIGFLFGLPASFVLICYAVQIGYDIWVSQSANSNRLMSRDKKSRTMSVAIVIQLLLLGAGGIAGLGLYTCNVLGPKMILSSEVVTIVEGDMMNEERLWIVGAFFGAAVAASVGVQLFGSAKLSSIHSPSQSIKMNKSVTEERALDSASIVSTLRVAYNIYTALLSGIFALTFPIWASEGHSAPLPALKPSTTSTSNGPFSSPSSRPNRRHAEDIPGKATKVIDMDMLMGIQITVVALAIVAVVVSGLASLGIVFGKEGLRRRDRKILGLEREMCEDDEIELEMR